MKTSILIPAKDEQYLQKTVEDILSQADDIEVIIILDGWWCDAPFLLKDLEKVKVIHFSESVGMRSAVNAGAKIAQGEYLLKCDAHCSFDKDFDKKLIADHRENWVQVPVRYSLDVRGWKPKTHRAYEFEYIDYETLKGTKWPQFAERIDGEMICDLMTFQGSCWFMTRKHFEAIGGEDDVNYGKMGREAQEICLKTWLSGGRCVLNRNTWYAHWSKSVSIPHMRDEKIKSVNYAVKHWKNEENLPKLNKLFDKFKPPNWKPMKEEKLVIHEGLNRAGLYRMFAEKGFKTGAEVGVQRGRNAHVMLKNIPDLKLYLIEAYKDHPGNRRRWGDKVHQKFRRQAHKRLKGLNVEWLEGFSEVMAYDVPEESLDFVYIDAEHTWDFVIVDLVTWYRKVRKGGIISGHDYEYRGNGHLKHNAKVAQALKHFTEIYKVKQIHLTDKHAKELAGDGAASWFFEKT